MLKPGLLLLEAGHLLRVTSLALLAALPLRVEVPRHVLQTPLGRVQLLFSDGYGGLELRRVLVVLLKNLLHVLLFGVPPPCVGVELADL